jgi:flagellar FliL protein
MALPSAGRCVAGSADAASGVPGALLGKSTDPAAGLPPLPAGNAGPRRFLPGRKVSQHSVNRAVAACWRARIAAEREMASAAAEANGEADSTARKSSGRRKILLLGLPVVIAGAAGGLWSSGVVPRLLHRGSVTPGAGETPPPPPVFAELPEIVANLDAGPRRTGYVKLKARLELEKPGDAKTVQEMMPRLLDLFQTYLRETRPDELRASAGTYRLREELIARANVALAPVHVKNVLFTELLVQ